MMISKEQDDPDENTVLVDSFRASFERWSRPANRQAAQPNEAKKPVTENTRLADSYRTALVGWVPPFVPGSTVNVQDTTTELEGGLQPLSLHEPLHSSTESASQPSSLSKQSSLGHDDEGKTGRGSGTPGSRDESKDGSSVKNQDEETTSITSNETVNGEVPMSPVTAPSRRPQPSPNPIMAEEEKKMKAEVASPELKAELKAIQESIRNGSWWAKRAKERRELRFGCSNPEAMKLGANDKNYVVEPYAASQTNYVDNFPKGISARERHEMQYTVYRESARAHPRYKRGKGILASTTKTDTPAYETVPPTPSPKEMYKTLVLNRSREDGAEDNANWRLYPHAPKKERYELAKQLWLWLDDTIPLGWIVDIFHEPFFTGIAHADGMRGFYISPELLDYAAQKEKLMTDYEIKKEPLRLASPGDYTVCW